MKSKSSAGAKKPVANRRSGPPYNPGLQQLVAGKKAWSEPLDDGSAARGFLGWHQRGYLPHCDRPGLTQFVTFRLHDALPARRRSEWEALLRIEDDRQRRAQLETYLDRGLGGSWLGQAGIAQMAENALRFFDGDRYQLRAWVVMPNHVHLLVDVWQTPLAQLVQSWKRFIAREAGKLLARTGAFWQRDYWDTYIRDAEHLAKAVRYIENNPVKARLADEARKWPWSSARFRDEMNRPGANAGSRLQTGAPAQRNTGLA
jgi:REP-associated tyrosine transposase